MLTKIFIFALILGAVLTVYFYFIRKSKGKGNPISSDMRRVENFKESEYINETFKEVFDSIEYGKYDEIGVIHQDSYTDMRRYDLDEWKCKVSDGDIYFTKIIEYPSRDSSGNRINSRARTIVGFNYSFNNNGEFEVGKCKLELPTSIVDNYSDATMYYRKGYDKKFKYFLYTLYKKWKDEKNEILKERADKKLKGIKMVIGKSSTRKSKIDKLMNS